MFPRKLPRRGGGTPAMRLGLEDRGVPIEELLRERRFPSRVELPAEWARYDRGEVRTRRLARVQRRRLKLAT